MKKLFLKKDSFLLGVCSGLAEYFGRDVVVIRIMFLILTILTGVYPMCTIYLILFLLIPKEK